MARSALGLLVFALALPPLAAQQQQQALKQAGVCSRCHVAQVLEWSASKHTAAQTTCQSCHGPSAAHIANERNEVKPDRLPHGDQAVAALCATCHAAGCPKTRRVTACQSCHHQHALSNPDDKQMRPVARVEDTQAAEVKRYLEQAEQQVVAGNWRAARDLFASAARLAPSNRRAASRLQMVERRLDPRRPGFEIVGDAFDPDSGLPMRVRVAGLGIEMRLVPGGETDLGSDALPRSRPVHSVAVKPFYLATHELTQQQWSALGVANPSEHKGDALPVHNVSWQDAQQWIRQLNARIPGGEFRLPSEAEWERAAASTARQGAIAEQAWFRDNSAITTAAATPATRYRQAEHYAPRPVGLQQPNASGFFDMQGNVAEWCSSLDRPYPYDARDGRESPDAEGMRIVRGGSYADSSESLDPTFRHAERPTRRLIWNGLRLAR